MQGEKNLPKVTVRNNNVEAAIRVFKRKVTNDGLIFEIRERQHYEKPSSRRNKAKQAAKLREKRRRTNESKNW